MLRTTEEKGAGKEGLEVLRGSTPALVTCKGCVREELTEMLTCAEWGEGGAASRPGSSGNPIPGKGKIALFGFLVPFQFLPLFLLPVLP